MDLPIVCTLSESELAERRRTLIASLGDLALARVETPDGIEYRFAPSSGTLGQLAHLVDLERQCCRFLTFRIIVEPQSPIVLEITGPPAARSFLAGLFA